MEKPSFGPEAGQMDSRVEAVVSLMGQFMGDKLSISALSSCVHVSHVRLRQLFRQETGISPIKYLRRLRMQRAADLLRSTRLTIKEVAFQVGATDLSHFMRDFKKEHGFTARNFRTRHSSLL